MEHGPERGCSTTVIAAQGPPAVNSLQPSAAAVKFELQSYSLNRPASQLVTAAYYFDIKKIFLSSCCQLDILGIDSIDFVVAQHGRVCTPALKKRLQHLLQIPRMMTAIFGAAFCRLTVGVSEPVPLRIQLAERSAPN